MTKTYKIKVDGLPFLRILLNELRGWGVNESRYKVDVGTSTITTRDANVVDVATETFMHSPQLLHVTTE